MPAPAPIILSYRYRLLPTKQQHAALARILEDQRQLYNACLAERIDAYQRSLLEVERHLRPKGTAARLGVRVQEGTFRLVDR